MMKNIQKSGGAIFHKDRMISEKDWVRTRVEEGMDETFVRDAISYIKKSARQRETNSDECYRFVDFFKSLGWVPKKPILLYRGMTLNKAHQGDTYIISQTKPTSWTTSKHIGRLFSVGGAAPILLSRVFSSKEILFDITKIPVTLRPYLYEHEIMTLPGRYSCEVLPQTPVEGLDKRIQKRVITIDNIIHMDSAYLAKKGISIAQVYEIEKLKGTPITQVVIQRLNIACYPTGRIEVPGIRPYVSLDYKENLILEDGWKIADLSWKRVVFNGDTCVVYFTARPASRWAKSKQFYRDVSQKINSLLIEYNLEIRVFITPAQ